MKDDKDIHKKCGRGVPKIKNIPAAIEEIIYRRYTLGQSMMTIRLYLQDEYNIGKDRAYELIREAKEQIGKLHSELNQNVLQDAIEILEKMREKNIAQGENKLALSVQQEINKLQQLHIQKLDIDCKINIEQKLFEDIIDKKDENN